MEEKNREENNYFVRDGSMNSLSVDSEVLANFKTFSNCNLDNPKFNCFTNNTIIQSSKRRRTLHSTFILLKKKLNLEQFMRKTQIDSLLKKCKSKVFKTIHEALKKCLNIKLPRLPQNFITNIKIDFNKVYLEKTILEIYREHNIIPSVEEFLSKKYLIDDKVQVFKDFLTLTFKNVFDFYINSKQYVKDYYHIQKRDGEKFAILFNYISKVFIQYYTKSKGNKPKQDKNCLNNNYNCNGYLTDENINNPNVYLNNFSSSTTNLNNFANCLDIDKNFNHNTQNTLSNLKGRNKENFQPQQIKRKPVFKRIKVKRVLLKRKIVKVCEVTTSIPIFEIRKHLKKETHIDKN